MTHPVPSNADETKPPGQRYPVFDLERDFEAAWEALKRGEPGAISERTIEDLVEVIDRFGQRCTAELGKNDQQPPLGFATCDIARCHLGQRALRFGLIFNACTFTRTADFSDVVFEQGAGFADCRFLDDAIFSRTEFRKPAEFSGAMFMQFARFIGTTFTGSLTLEWARFHRSPLDMRRADFKPAADAPDAPMTINIKNLSVGTGVLTADLLLSRDELDTLRVVGESSDSKDDLEAAARQYSDLAGNFRAMASPESYELEDYCRDRYYELQRKLCAKAPRFWQRGVGVATWWIFKYLLCYLQSPRKLLWRVGAVILVCTVLFMLPGFGIVDADGNRPDDAITYLYFSGISFTTIGYGDWRPVGAARLVAMAEGLLGITLSACFTISLTRRYIR